MVKNKTQKTWLKAKTIIPGGNMLLSKRPEMFLPNKWPAYFSKAKGCFIHDLDNKKYLDMSLMGVGTCVLGYANSEIDNAVIKNIKRGNMSTLNCEEEYLLSEKILSFNKWADMVRYARTGGEANAIAIRLARASCNEKNKILLSVDTMGGTIGTFPQILKIKKFRSTLVVRIKYSWCSKKTKRNCLSFFI